MSFIKLPAKKPRKKLKLHINGRKVLRLVIVLAVLAVVIGGTAAAWPWLKSKGVVPVADNERRDNLHTSRDQKEYSAQLLKNLEENEPSVKDAEPSVRYEHYAKKAGELTALERYEEAEQTYLAAERTGYPAENPAIAEAHYISFGIMYEAQGNDSAAHSQYLKAESAVKQLNDSNEMKTIKLEEIAELLKRTEG